MALAERVDKLEALEKEIREEGGRQLYLDVMDRDSLRNAVDVVENQLGLITINKQCGMVDAQWAVKQVMN